MYRLYKQLIFYELPSIEKKGSILYDPSFNGSKFIDNQGSIRNKFGK